MPSRTPDARVTHALEHLQRGRLDEAARLLTGVLNGAPDDADALQLMGLLLRRRGAPAGAERHLRRSLAVAPAQPHVHNNLGNVLLDRGDAVAAAACYARAVELAPAYADAWRNLAVVELRRGRVDDAARAVECALRLAPTDAGTWLGAGDVAMRRGLPSEAATHYSRATELAPTRASAWHKLALAFREGGEFDRAYAAIAHARALADAAPEVHYSLGNVALDLGRVAEAEEAYRAALRLHPGYREAHAALNKLLRQYRGGAGYLESYAAGVEHAPDAPALYVDWAEKLLLSAQGATALQVLERAVARGLDGPELHHARAKVLADQGRLDDSLVAFRRALDAAPTSNAARIDYARVLLSVSRRTEARAQLEAALAADPYDQVALAYLGLCVDANDDACVHAWFDDASLVKTYALGAPPGYARTDDWLQALAAALEGLHDAVEAPAEQTLRGGTQTLGDLFAHRTPALQSLQALLAPAIDEYVASLARGVTGPLTARRGAGWRYAGSWSVRLRRGGYHTNHVHAEGWISSCYYVTVPRVVAGSASREGWLKFGQANLGVDAGGRVRRYVEPQPGMLVLFPSYFFHGTEPFTSDEYRTTVAFDVVPTAPRRES